MGKTMTIYGQMSLFNLSANISSFLYSFVKRSLNKLLVGAYLPSTLCPDFIQHWSHLLTFCVNSWFCFDIVLNVFPFLARLALFWFSCNLLSSLAAAAAELASLHARTVTLSHPFCYTTSRYITVYYRVTLLLLERTKRLFFVNYHTQGVCRGVWNLGMSVQNSNFYVYIKVTWLDFGFYEKHFY